MRTKYPCSLRRKPHRACATGGHDRGAPACTGRAFGRRAVLIALSTVAVAAGMTSCQGTRITPDFVARKTPERSGLQEAIEHDDALLGFDGSLRWTEGAPSRNGALINPGFYSEWVQRLELEQEYPHRHLVVDEAFSKAMLDGPRALYTTGLRQAVVRRLHAERWPLAPAIVLRQHERWPGLCMRITLSKWREAIAVDERIDRGFVEDEWSRTTTERAAASVVVVSNGTRDVIWSWESHFDSSIVESKRDKGLIIVESGDRQFRRASDAEVFEGLARQIELEWRRRVDEDPSWRERFVRDDTNDTNDTDGSAASGADR